MNKRFGYECCVQGGHGRWVWLNGGMSEGNSGEVMVCVLLCFFLYWREWEGPWREGRGVDGTAATYSLPK